MNANLTICLSPKFKVPHKVRSLLTTDLIMRASHRHLSSAFTQFYKHVNPLSSMGLFLTLKQDLVQEINPSYFCVLQNTYYTLITSTNELFILCFVIMLFLNIPQWWQRGFCIFKFCTMYVPKIYKIQENGLELSQSTLENDRGNLIKIISGYIWNAVIAYVYHANLVVCSPKYLCIMKLCKYLLQTLQ